MSDVFESFIQPMLRHFTEPPGIDPEGFFGDLKDDLRSFSDVTLQTAAAEFRTTRKYRTFPSAAECLTACRTVAPGHAQTKPARRDESSTSAEWRAKREARRRAAATCRCDLGRQAAREGWIPGLLDFVAESARLPNQHESGQWSRGCKGARKISISCSITRNPERAFEAVKIGGALARLRAAMCRVAQRDVAASKPVSPHDPERISENPYASEV